MCPLARTHTKHCNQFVVVWSWSKHSAHTFTLTSNQDEISANTSGQRKINERQTKSCHTKSYSLNVNQAPFYCFAYVWHAFNSPCKTSWHSCIYLQTYCCMVYGVWCCMYVPREELLLLSVFSTNLHHTVSDDIRMRMLCIRMPQILNSLFMNTENLWKFQMEKSCCEDPNTQMVAIPNIFFIDLFWFSWKFSGHNFV